jgi:hypothetical protein
MGPPKKKKGKWVDNINANKEYISQKIQRKALYPFYTVNQRFSKE